jgi:TRAP-type uncharacterized transport system fused permease subunit
VFTGLGVKLSYFAAGLMGENLIGKLALVMVACIILGMEVPTSAAYILVSFIAAPILVEANVNLYAAHFFAFYFAVFSVVTPPVAPAAAYGAALAKGSYFKTGLESSKLCIAGFLVPYLCVFFPPILLEFSETTFSDMVLGFMSSVFIIFNMQVSFVGYYLTHCSAVHRALALVTSLFLIVYLTTQSVQSFIGGIIFFLALTILQVRRSNKTRPTKVTLVS